MLTAINQAATSAYLAAGDLHVDPGGTVNKARVLAIAVLGVGLILVSVAGVFGPGRKGNTRKSVDIVMSTSIVLIPGVIGALGIALAFGASILGWAIPGISS